VNGPPKEKSMGRIDGKVAIITGAGSGIGRATALRFAAEGAKVIVADVTGAEDETARAIGANAVAVHADVSKSADVQSMIEAARTRFGRLDIIFNNAGIEGQQAPTADCSEENFDRVISINLRGVFLGMKYAIPFMIAGGGGSVINTASVAGLVGFQGLPAYCASKGGVIQLTKTAALEYATQNIRVNAICPGVIWTPMVQRLAVNAEAEAAFRSMEPVGRFGTPDDIASMALFLASDESSFVTGAALPADGAYVAQ
jgi:NAD(P)-dependent dehydrogenase (short-subunit alcohol dehydrogenase family)